MPKILLRAAVVCAIILCAARAPAQTKETLARFGREAHIGPVETALAGVSVTFRDKAGSVIEVRRGDGMVLRCDGFLLFPAGLLAHRRNEPEDIRPDIQISLLVGTASVRYAAPWPAHVPADVPLRMVKLPNVHAPALRTLLPDLLQPGDLLTVAWRQWDRNKSAFGAVQKRTLHYAGRSPELKKRAICLLQEPLEDITAGAVVLGPEGMAVGIVTAAGPGARPEFASMEALSGVTNCVVPVPMSDGAFAASQAAARFQDGAPVAASADPASTPAGAGPPAGGMVLVGGGPVALLRSVLNQEDEMQGASVACLPPFYIDRTEVTNRQYWDWWNKLPAKSAAQLEFRRLCRPLGWAAGAVPFAEELNDVPVLGVPFTAAQAYARAQGKRLPTPYEWCLAALGPAGEGKPPAWMAQYIEDRKATAQRIKEAHLRFLAAHSEDIDAESFIHATSRANLLVPLPGRRDSKFVGIPDPRINPTHVWARLPWIIYPEPALTQAPLAVSPNVLYRLTDRLAMQEFSKRAVDREVEGLWNTYKAPMHILPGGSRGFDISPYGVSDMLFNAHEYVVGPPFAPHSEQGFTLYVNWVGMASKALSDDYLVLPGSGTVETYWPPSRIMQMPRSARLARWMQIGLNIRDVRSLFYLIGGWSFEMGPEPLHELHEVREAFPWTNAFPAVQDEFPVWLHSIWSGKSSREVKEIGSAADLEQLAAMPTETGQMGFAFLTLDVLRPVGFRCAR
jgi:hypothetical protein